MFNVLLLLADSSSVTIEFLQKSRNVDADDVSDLYTFDVFILKSLIKLFEFRIRSAARRMAIPFRSLKYRKVRTMTFYLNM